MFQLAARVDEKDFVIQELMRSGAGCGCMTKTHLHDFFWLSPAAPQSMNVNKRRRLLMFTYKQFLKVSD
jgi:hypothetical protein